MKWQRELLPLLSRINPNTQIIVATHSPAIAHKHTEYLVELV
jgi:predicted ATP-binding protein involved in virulence